MKVLIVDKLSAKTVAVLQRLALEVEVRHDLEAETLPEVPTTLAVRFSE